MRTSGEAKGRERPMTYRALREQIRRQLEKAGCDSPAFDADCLLEDLGGGRDAAHSDRDVPEECRLAVERAAAERAGGRPLQYILGRWGFLRLTLEVGEDSFVSLLATQGSGVVCGPENSLAFGPGDSLVLPAGAGKVRIAGEATLIKTTVPQRAGDAPETL